MVDHATAKYLSDNVGTVLATALADMAVAQPADGVDFLSRWLNLYAEQEEDKERQQKEKQELEAERVKTKAALDAKEAEAKKKTAEAQAKVTKYQDLVSKFSNPDTIFDKNCWEELVGVAQTATGAKAVYLGLLEEEGLDGEAPGPCIAYTNTTQGSEWLVDRVLPDQTGVTWGAFKQNPEEEEFAKACLWRPPKPAAPDPADAPEPNEGEEPPAEGEEGEANKAPTLPFYPVNVPCVTDVDQVHYFDMTRLGAYLAVPLVYPSYYTADALADAKTFETEKKAEEAAREEARLAKETAHAEAVAAAEAAGEEPPPEDPPEEAPPEKQMVLRGKDVKMVLCIDTLGTNASIDEAKIPELLELCKACALCKSQTETRFVDTQALLELDDAARAAADERLAEVRAEAAEALKEEQEAEEAALGEEEQDKKPLIQEKYVYLRALKVAKDLQDDILKLCSWVVAPQELIDLVSSLAFVVLQTKEQVFPKKKSKLDWAKLSSEVLTPALLEAHAACDLTATRKGLAPEQMLKAIKEKADALDEEKAKAIWPMVEPLAAVLRQAVAYRLKYIEWRRAEFEKEKAAVPEGEEFSGTPLAELDDDFVE